MQDFLFFLPTERVEMLFYFSPWCFVHVFRMEAVVPDKFNEAKYLINCNSL